MEGPQADVQTVESAAAQEPAPEAVTEPEQGGGGASRSDLMVVAALLLPLVIIAGVFGYRAVTDAGPGFECTPEHQALGHC